MEAHPNPSKDKLPIPFGAPSSSNWIFRFLFSASEKKECRLNEKPLILASASPRRRYWLEAMRIPFEVMPPKIDETPMEGESPERMVRRLSKEKSLTIVSCHPGRWVLGADTTVVLDQLILGKPTNESDAARMLQLIQGKAHIVHTGACLAKDKEVYEVADTAKVHLRSLSEACIDWYVATGEPMDKAGAYAVQGIAALFIERIEGSFSTVMGLPVERLGELFFRLGLLEEWFHTFGCRPIN
jgi:septum formation protein